MSGAELARAVVGCLTHDQESLVLPQYGFDRHRTLADAWSSWRELPQRPERLSALRTALDEALSRDAELRAWARESTNRTDLGTAHRRDDTDAADPALSPPDRALAAHSALADALAAWRREPGRPEHRLVLRGHLETALTGDGELRDWTEARLGGRASGQVTVPPSPACPPALPMPPVRPPRWGWRRRKGLGVGAAVAVVVTTVGIGLAVTGRDDEAPDGRRTLIHQFDLKAAGYPPLHAEIRLTIGKGTTQPDAYGYLPKHKTVNYPVRMTIVNTGLEDWHESFGITFAKPDVKPRFIDESGNHQTRDEDQFGVRDLEDPDECHSWHEVGTGDLALDAGRSLTYDLTVPQLSSDPSKILVRLGVGAFEGDDSDRAVWSVHFDGRGEKVAVPPNRIIAPSAASSPTDTDSTSPSPSPSASPSPAAGPAAADSDEFSCVSAAEVEPGTSVTITKKFGMQATKGPERIRQDTRRIASELRDFCDDGCAAS